MWRARFIYVVLSAATREVGGILVGIHSANLSVNRVSNGDFSVKFHVRSKMDGFD
jgi:hypothetical protein